MSSTFGRLFRVTTWGESHGPALGCTIDGCPAGLALDRDALQAELRRRGPIVFQELEAKDFVSTLAKVMPQNFEITTDPDNPPRLVIEWKNSE